MADYTLNINDVSDVQVASAQHQMDLDNAVRTVNGEPVFASLKEVLEHTIKTGFLSDWVEIYEQHVETTENLKKAFLLADATTQDQIRTLLAPHQP